MGQDERGAGAGALLSGFGMGGGGQRSATPVAGADRWMDGEADAAQGRRTDASEFADGEQSCGGG